jgi:hypothetical protein
VVVLSSLSSGTNSMQILEHAIATVLYEPFLYFRCQKEMIKLINMEFKCYECNAVFEGEGIRVDYKDPIYGPCSKVVLNCLQCGSECTEYRKPKPSKDSNQTEKKCPPNHTGSCSCCH